MEAMIFAAGLGTRLYPITRDKPKALAPFLDGTLLQYNLQFLARQGVDHFIINTHHFAREIESYLAQHQYFNLDIDISYEHELLDTAGGIAKARKYLRSFASPVLLYNVDIITGLDVKQFLSIHNSQLNDITLVTKNRATSRYLIFDTTDRLVGWQNRLGNQVKPPGLNVDLYFAKAFSGIQLISRSSLDKLENNRIYSLIDFYLEQFNSLKIGAFSQDEDYWFDCGKIETLSKAENFMQSE